MNCLLQGAVIGVMLAGAAMAGEQTPATYSSSPSMLTGDAVRGEHLYARRCGACHSVDQNRIGPMHRNVFGRKAGAVEGYSYSKALRKLDVVWSEATLDLWLENPAKMAPGTMMGFRLADAQERADIISYLRTISDAAEAEAK